MRNALFILCLWLVSLSMEAQVPQEALTDTVSLGEIFDPEANLDMEKRTTELIGTINSHHRGIHKSFFTVATPLILVAILFLQLFLILFLPGIFTYNMIYYYKVRQHRDRLLKHNLLLGDYLNSDAENPPIPQLPGMLCKQNQQLLLEYVGQTIRFFGGTIEKRLISLYRANVKPENINRILSGMNNYQKAHLFRKCVTIPPRPEIIKTAFTYINNPDNDLRLWSRMLYLKGCPSDFIKLFSHYPYHLTRWEQIIYCEYLNQRKSTRPLLAPLLQEKNETVVLFALQMMRIFKQPLDTADRCRLEALGKSPINQEILNIDNN